MQNSRRAGATELRFLVTEDPQDRTRSIVHIADDGSGILDRDKLLYVAESGWDAHVVEKEDASASASPRCCSAAGNSSFARAVTNCASIRPAPSSAKPLP